jgi:EmrB/QacA subfamily drug resistance transporter
VPGQTATPSPADTEMAAAPSAMFAEDALAELPARKRWLALAVLCVTVLVANLDSAVLNVTLPTLVRDLSATSGDLQWIVDSYIVVFAGSLLAAGSLADRIGRKKTLLTGLAVFASGSVWAAFSGDVGTLIAARASMGIGGALMIPSTLSIISNMFRDPAERQRAIGRWGATSGIGVALGPIIGGFLLARFWWGSVFLINVPIAMAGLLAAYWLVPDSKNPAAKAPDLAGAGLSMAGTGVILWSIIEAPSRGWSSPLVIGAGAGGLAVLALFAVWEKVTDHPMLNLSFFRQRPFSAAILAVVTLTFGLFGALFVLTQFLQLALGFTALQAGISLLPVAAAVIVVAPVSAVGVRAIGPKFTIAAGLALVATGLWLISGAAVSAGFTGLAAGMVLLGTGAALALPTATGSVVGSVPPTDSGVASAADSTAIQLGCALGVAVVGSLLATRYQDRMTGALSGRPLPATVKNSLGGALAAPRVGGTTGPPLIHLAKTAFISGMDLGLLTGAVVAVAGCLVALICLPARSGRKDQLIGTGRGFPLRLRASTPGHRRRAGSPPGQHQRADLEADHHDGAAGAQHVRTLCWQLASVARAMLVKLRSPLPIAAKTARACAWSGNSADSDSWAETTSGLTGLASSLDTRAVGASSSQTSPSA